MREMINTTTRSALPPARARRTLNGQGPPGRAAVLPAIATITRQLWRRNPPSSSECAGKEWAAPDGSLKKRLKRIPRPRPATKSPTNCKDVREWIEKFSFRLQPPDSPLYLNCTKRDCKATSQCFKWWEEQVRPLRDGYVAFEKFKDKLDSGIKSTHKGAIVDKGYTAQDRTRVKARGHEYVINTKRGCYKVPTFKNGQKKGDDHYCGCVERWCPTVKHSYHLAIKGRCFSNKQLFHCANPVNPHMGNGGHYTYCKKPNGEMPWGIIGFG